MSKSQGDGELERLVTRAAEGDELAWRTLWSRLEPRLEALVRRRTFAGRAPGPNDDTRDVVVAVMARLRDQDFQRLKQYLAARRGDPALTFMRWLIVVAKRVAIDVMRSHPDYVDRRRSADRGDGAPGSWIENDELPADDSMSGGRPPFTNRLAARQILRYADGVLSPQQRRALQLWVENVPAEAIARALELPAVDDAERLVRSSLERLRRHFRKEPQA